MSLSALEQVATLPAAGREVFYESLDEPTAALVANGDWSLGGRPEQRPPVGEWMLWVVMGGRGAGKTRTGAEYVLDRHEQGSKRCALIAKHAADVREVMIEGPSGLLASSKRRGVEARWIASRKRLDLRSEWGHTACNVYYGNEPESLAGPEHDTAWMDEWTAYITVRDSAGRTALDNLVFGLRSLNDQLGQPRGVLTSTPRPLEAVRSVVERADAVITTMTMFDNVRNLAPTFLQSILDRYEGTRLERQEIYGELTGAEGVYFTRADVVVLDEAPVLPTQVRYWDLAHARASAVNPDPDWTVGLKLGTDGPRDVILDVRRARGNQLDVEQMMVETATADGPGVQQVMEQTPGAGKGLAEVMVRACAAAGVRLALDPVQKGKEQRAELPSRRVQQGRLQAVRGAWLDVLLDELEAFPDSAVHDDQVDALSGAVNWLDKKRGRAPRPQSRRVTDTRIAAKVPWAL